MGRAFNTEVWVSRHPQTLPAFMLCKDADELVQGIFGRPFAGQYRVLARDVQISYAEGF